MKYKVKNRTFNNPNIKIQGILIDEEFNHTYVNLFMDDLNFDVTIKSKINDVSNPGFNNILLNKLKEYEV